METVLASTILFTLCRPTDYSHGFPIPTYKHYKNPLQVQRMVNWSLVYPKWSDKIPKAVWRGGLIGHDKDHRRVLTHIVKNRMCCRWWTRVGRSSRLLPKWAVWIWSGVACRPEQEPSGHGTHHCANSNTNLWCRTNMVIPKLNQAFTSVVEGYISHLDKRDLSWRQHWADHQHEYVGRQAFSGHGGFTDSVRLANPSCPGLLVIFLVSPQAHRLHNPFRIFPSGDSLSRRGGVVIAIYKEPSWVVSWTYRGSVCVLLKPHLNSTNSLRRVSFHAW